MSQIEVEHFLGRIITDADFRAKAARSLPTACCDAGIVLSPQELQLLHHVDFSKFCQVADILDDSIRRN